MKLAVCSLTAILLLTSVFSAQAAPRPLELKWTELSAMIVGHQVTITLTDDLIVGGEVASVRDDTLVLDVTRSAKGYPKGNGSIPRRAVKLIGLERKRGVAGRAIGTTLGVLFGLGLGSAAAFQTSGGAPAATVFLGIAGGLTVMGHYVGGQLDRRITWIKIIP